MAQTSVLPRGIGDNNPPEPTPYEAAVEKVTALYDEALQWLDGEPVDRQELADGLARMLNDIRAAKKQADDARKIEAEPFDKGKAEVQSRYKPLLEKADLAADACKKALAPWLAKIEEAKRAEAERLRKIAEEAERAAQEAIRKANAENLAARESAEALVKKAKADAIAANKAGRDTAKAAGGSGRAVSLRSVWRPELTDLTAACRYFWSTTMGRKEFEMLVQRLAEEEVRHGKREIAGFNVVEEKVAV